MKKTKYIGTPREVRDTRDTLSAIFPLNYCSAYTYGLYLLYPLQVGEGYAAQTFTKRRSKMTDRELYEAVMSAKLDYCDDCGEPLYLLPDWPKDRRHDCTGNMQMDAYGSSQRVKGRMKP